MKKITVNVFVPASGNDYEMRIPRNIRAGKANEMILDYLNNKSDESFIPNSLSRLCSCKTGEPYDWNLYIDELGLENGERVLII